MTGEPRGRHRAASGRTPTEAASRLLRRDRRLLAFPLAALAGLAAAVPPAIRAGQAAGVAALVLALRAMPGADPVALLPLAAYPALAAGISVVSLPLLVCNTGLMHATDRVRRGERPSVVAGFVAAARRLPHAAVLALVVGLTLALGGMTERKAGRTRPGLVGRALGSSFTGLTYLAGAAAVLDGASPVGMFRRSRTLLEARYGPAPTVDFGPLKKYLLVGLLPTMFLESVVLFFVPVLGVPALGWLEHPAVLAAAAAPLVLALVYGWAVAAVTKALLLVALREDRRRLPISNADVDGMLESGVGGTGLDGGGSADAATGDQ